MSYMKTVCIWPAYLQSALVSGDTSGLTDEQRRELEIANDFIGDGYVDFVSDPWFSWYNDLVNGRNGTDVAEFYILRKTPSQE
jgi:hypothetical protein